MLIKVHDVIGNFRFYFIQIEYDYNNIYNDFAVQKSICPIHSSHVAKLLTFIFCGCIHHICRWVEVDHRRDLLPLDCGLDNDDNTVVCVGSPGPIFDTMKVDAKFQTDIFLQFVGDMVQVNILSVQQKVLDLKMRQ